MPKKYIVGIDFGHYKTASWVVPTDGATDMDPNGEPLRLKAANKVNERWGRLPLWERLALCGRHPIVFKKEDGTYSLEALPKSSVIRDFILPVNELNEKPELREAYKAYIRLVVEAVLANNPILTVNDTDGKPNFSMCMNAPTKCNDQDRSEYLILFNEAIADLGLSFERIIKESDAAFFSHKDKIDHDEVTLAIDYGSRTIGYTVMYQGKKVSNDEWSNDKLGAEIIEREILNSYRTKDSEGYQAAWSVTRELLNAKGLHHIDIDNVLNHECRMIKEDAYTKGMDSNSLDFHFGAITEDWSLMRHRFEYDFSLPEVTAQYRAAVQKDIENLRDKIKNVIGRDVDKVILSGGACIMPWVERMLRSIFPHTQIVNDHNPSFVVARGIALYAAAQKKAPKKYIVGIDFGHGETAAWVVPLAEGAELDPNGESLRLRATNKVNERATPSIVYKKEDGTYSLTALPKSSLIGKMKARISELNRKPELKEAYKAYIRLVVKAVLEHNPILTLDGGANFYMCMASPTKWDDQDKNEYLKFFNEAIAGLGLSFEWIINESDAAFFSHKDSVDHDEVTLVIDYGSSTIDYTVMYHGEKVSKDEWSNGELGAGTIERDILNSYRATDYEGYQAAWSGTQELLNATGLHHIDIDNVLNYQCRQVKEEAYTNGIDRIFWDYHFVPLTEDMSFRRHRFEYDFSLPEVTAQYRAAVRKDIEDLRDKIKEVIGRDVDKIILSGGACIMHWVKKMVKSVFPDIQILDDTTPSFVVARGIALYAAAQKKALEELLDSIRAENFADTYRAADIQAIKDVIRDLSGPAVEEVREQLNCIKMVECFGNYIRGLDNTNPQFVYMVRSKVHNAVTKTVGEALKNVFWRHFNWVFDASGINVDVNVVCASWAPSLFYYSLNGGSLITNKTGWSKTIKTAIINIRRHHHLVYTGTNWTDERSQSERDYISAELVDEVLKLTDWLDTISYGKNNSFLEAQADAIKEQALSYAEKTFFENQLFRTTFAHSEVDDA